MIFISHSSKHKNLKIFQKLISDLKQDEFDIWLDNSKILPGMNWMNEIKKAIENSKNTIYILPPKEQNHSNWASIEFDVAYVKEVFEKKDILIPIKITEEISTSSQFGNMTYIDFYNNYDDAYKILLTKLKEHELESKIDFDLDLVQQDNFSLIQVTSRVNLDLIKFFDENPERLKTMDRRLFEEFVAELFHGFGYSIELTKQTRDGGKDIIAIKNDIVRQKYLIECKRPDPGNKVSIGVVKQLFATKNDELATKGVLVTTATFTRDALLFFDKHKWELEPVENRRLRLWMKDYINLKNYR